ncbi:DUF1643 domain-containing protein [Nocardia sp. BSTN01]|uniref:DUF1643 domain-containing protein n=1 Tax=Nocardia sp. BSTN01 TaxID=2783665 RepID=UPI00188EE1B1|nr:DUF1643 domain-containing protein [Nocardia sp. BSTN01]MBF4998647.1 DUF1643 domain-containing protein [Nocardia sp. BSTN01]
MLSNPPVTDGRRTARRVDLATMILGFDAYRIVNMFAWPSHATGELNQLGTADSGWAEARPDIVSALNSAGGVLLGYGSTAPVGAARIQFRAQVDWLKGQLSTLMLPVWQFGDGPRHPSRWQRWTYRAHPNIPFDEAVRLSLVPVGHGPVGVPTRV